MENLPWNMFTSDIVAEETDEILTDEIVADYNRSALVEDEDAPRVKQEPEDFRDNDEDYDSQMKDAALGAAANDEDDEGDDAIFNFDLEPQVNIAEGDDALAAVATPPPRPVQNEDVSQSGSISDANINYESAVVYICPACGAEYDTQNAWKLHMNSKHNYNTRRGLNFVQVDKLYHQCLECHKRIAMHAMENLLKHKFTHLPYRCTKCKICLRQYKYRQDLMVHLRVTHREDLLPSVNQSLSVRAPTSVCRLEIKDIKENAIDIFENNFEGIEVKNELIEPDEDTDIDAIAEQTSSSFVLPSFLEDALSRSSSSEQYRVSGQDEETFEKCIHYICPECGMEYKTQEQWRQHVEFVHDFGSRKGLNFKEVNMNRHAQCLECDKIIQVNIIPNLQQHKFTHLPHKSWMRCKFCLHAFVGRKEILKHLATQHRVCAENPADESQGARTGPEEEEEDDDSNAADDQLLTEQSSKAEERDACEPHIDYLCPQCGKDFLDKKMWRKHIVSAHHLTDLSVLNFRVINERQVMCNECDKIITNAYGVQNAQQHRITHMPYKAYIRCRLCSKSYTDRKGLVKHLRSMHSIGDELPLSTSNTTSAAPSPQPLAVYASVLQSMPPLQPKPPHKLHGKPQKEIVKHANVTYEIQYLDDDDEITMQQAGVPELAFNRSLKCADCGSVFDNQQVLKAHIRDEHEFPDFKNRNSELSRRLRDSSSGAASRHQMPQDEPSNDADDLLIPTGDEEVSSSSTQGGGGAVSAAIERNFCYLCPACGVEFKTQLDWRRHINEAHNFDKRQYLNFRAVDKFRFQCTECNDIVSSSKLKGLQDHKFRHLPFKLYIMCIICGTCYNHKPNMLSHLRMRHNIIDTRPPDIRELNYTQQLQFRSVNLRPAASAPSAATYAFNKPPGLKTVEDCISFHNAVDHESITYFCPQCNENFDTHVFWRKHIVDEHNLNNRHGLNFRQIDEHHYLCLQCYKRVTVTHTKGAIGQLQSHKFRHLPFKSFKCNACQGEFVRKQMFFKHLSKQTNRCDAMPIEPILVDGEVNHDETNQGGGGDVVDDHFSQQAGISNALIMNENSFMLVCPQCSQQFESWRPWREHINISHNLGKRETLNFKKINSHLHQCLECKEQVSGVKLRDLQIHKFKHLPHGAYIQCRFCDAAYYHVSNMKTHLRQKHPNVVQNHDEYAKMEELQQYEDVSPTDTENSNDMAVEEVEEVEEPNDEQFLLG